MEAPRPRLLPNTIFPVAPDPSSGTEVEVKTAVAPAPPLRRHLKSSQWAAEGWSLTRNRHTHTQWRAGNRRSCALLKDWSLRAWATWGAQGVGRQRKGFLTGELPPNLYHSSSSESGGIQGRRAGIRRGGHCGPIPHSQCSRRISRMRIWGKTLWITLIEKLIKTRMGWGGGFGRWCCQFLSVYVEIKWLFSRAINVKFYFYE
jgi:hypothetical protein